ncbi:hypothetical protein BV25DRAFT_368207 [Artomyces pyxidatus]|uniref:Uncharacterized protein n=1 Tax=Artomyces pyxidatus TaxID=48021 RepID=A0ACB8T5S0_9AGAM|nr:hypothetical protein BV25DRAFT_368207 [Artomyces pyxidatus]
MLIPGFTSVSRSDVTRRDLPEIVRRKGGGKGRGGGSGSKSSGSGGSKGKGSPSKPSKPVSIPGLPSGRHSATAYGGGGGKITVIPSGQFFAGRHVGGGTRNQIYGNSYYGSGYPGVSHGNRGVAGLPFPFYFWPIVWGGVFLGTEAYLYEQLEYGSPSNTSRPGGPMAQAQFQSNSMGTTFHILADNSTVASLISTINANCSSYLSVSNSSTAPIAYDASNTTGPVPEQAIQYYRASSVALTLDGYNNSAALGGDPRATASPLPVGIDTALLTCINVTTGESVPLVGAGMQLGAPVALISMSIVLVQFFQALF